MLPFRNEPIWIEVSGIVPLVSASGGGVGGERALPNSSKIAPRTDGASTGIPM